MVYFTIIIWVILIVFVLILRSRQRREQHEIREQILERPIILQIERPPPRILNFDIILDISDNDEDECCICLMNLNNGKRIIEAQCKHRFHSECLNTWIKSGNQLSINCPLCLNSL